MDLLQFLILGNLFVVPCGAHQSPNPRMPERFTIQFNEVLYKHNASAPGGVADLYGNASGSWTYDVVTTRWVYEHGAGGGSSEFCGANDPSGQRCWLHFHANEDLKVLYGNGTCCSLCSAVEGCGFLRPDWLTFGGFTPIRQATVEIDGAECTGWGRPGAVTSVDAWFTTDDGTPCLYFERFAFARLGVIHHNVTFQRASYSTASISDAVWRLPDTCSSTCPRHGYPPRFDAAQGTRPGVARAIVV